jgi:peptidyl-prolyl cis-trans isomerase C
MNMIENAASMVSFLIAVSVMTVPFLSYGEQAATNKVLAEVGKETITKADIAARINMLQPRFRSRYETPDGKRQLLDQAIRFSLLAQEARSLGIDKKEDVARRIKQTSDSIIIEEITKQEVTEKLSVTEEEIAAHYNQNKMGFIVPEKVKAQLILFAVEEGTAPEAKEERKKRAGAALEKLKGGEDFETLARELSDDKRTKNRGGSTGFFYRGTRRHVYGDRFEETAFSLKTGELSGVFEGKHGFYIVKVVDRKAQKTQSLDEVRKKIERQIREEKQQASYEAYIDKLKEKYPVKLY